MTKSNVIGIIQSFVPGYRKPLFDEMYRQLQPHGLKLEVWHGAPRGHMAARGDAVTGEWSVPIRQHRLPVGSREIFFRNVMKRSRQARAVVAGLASLNMETYLLAADKKVNLMLWGHGKNFTTKNYALDLRLERWLATRSSHIFAYTDEGKDHLVRGSLRADDVTVVVNTTDAAELRRVKAGVTDQTMVNLRAQHSLGEGPVALYVGALDAPKQIPFLIDAFDVVRAKISDVTLVIAGQGHEEESIRSMAASRPHVRMIGRIEAKQFAELAPIVDCLVMPGRIGLVAVDALALGLPVVTTNFPYHAPEAAYLTPGQDSLWTEFEVDAYAQGVAKLLSNDDMRLRMAANAWDRGTGFSAEASAARFVDGILRGLES